MEIEIFYWGTVAFFITHELDAVRRHEWRIMPLLGRLPDTKAEPLFIYLHIPILLMIFWYSKEGANTTASLALSSFAILHLAMHWVFKQHPKNEFKGLGSWSIIVLTAFFGLLHITFFVIGS